LINFQKRLKIFRGEFGAAKKNLFPIFAPNPGRCNPPGGVASPKKYPCREKNIMKIGVLAQNLIRMFIESFYVPSYIYVRIAIRFICIHEIVFYKDQHSHQDLISNDL